MIELLKIQQELKAPKGQFNAFGKYKYRSAEDILEAAKPVLAKHNCLLTLSDELVSIGERYYIKATAKLSNGTQHLEVTAYAREEENKKGMDQSQITGTASSYARKYALNGMFLIDDTKDADTQDNIKEDYMPKLVKKLKAYKDPQKLDSEKIKIRDEFVKLGMDKKLATETILEYINGL